MYYLRSQPAADAIKFTVDIESLLSTSDPTQISKTAFKNIASVRSPLISTDSEEPIDKKQKSKKKDPPMFEMCFNCGS